MSRYIAIIYIQCAATYVLSIIIPPRTGPRNLRAAGTTNEPWIDDNR